MFKLWDGAIMLHLRSKLSAQYFFASVKTETCCSVRMLRGNLTSDKPIKHVTCHIENVHWKAPTTEKNQWKVNLLFNPRKIESEQRSISVNCNQDDFNEVDL